MTPHPQIVDYNEAVQNPATAFRDAELRRGRIRQNALGLPLVLSGGFALAYRMEAPRRSLAVRCFHRRIDAGEQKYAALARAVAALNSRYFVEFEYLVEGIRIRGGFHPIVKMEWAEGDPLGIWLDDRSRDRAALQWLRGQFAELAEFLEQQRIAHGDIQNGNVIVAPDGLRLVDYDGVYVPGMPAGFASESGHKHFQHPGRSTAHFGPDIDRFSFIAVDLSLAALIEDPSLHRRFRQGGETILFRANDFVDPDHSEIFRLLGQNPRLRSAAHNFAAICQGDIAAVPRLADFRADRGIPRAAPPATASPRSARYVAPCPVLDATDFAGVLRHVGQRVELVGRIDAVRQGVGERARRRERCIFVDFAPSRAGIVRATLWAEEPLRLREAPDASRAGRWVSVIGLVGPPCRSGYLWSRRSYVGIATENPRALDIISEAEARFRLCRDNGAAPQASPAADDNRRLAARLLSRREPSRHPVTAAPAIPPQSAPSPSLRRQPRQSNRSIVHALLRNVPDSAHDAPVIAAAPVAPRRPRSAPRAPLPRSGSIVIHPRNRAPTRTPPVQPERPRLFQRLLQFFGLDA
jgi:hypothetical protein